MRKLDKGNDKQRPRSLGRLVLVRIILEVDRDDSEMSI